VPAEREAAPTASELVDVPVWDLPVRLVHWAIVLLLVALVVTGLADNEWLEWHMRFGQTMLMLVVFRVLWGFAGSRNARFAAFLHPPQRVLRYARSLGSRAKEVHVTHNPLGGWMVIALLVALLVQGTTGLFTNDDVLWEGPLASRIAKDTSDALSSIHRRWWWLVVALSSLHVVAVLAYLAVLKDNLITAMFTGAKRLPRGAADPSHATASLARALGLLAICVIVVGYGIWRLAPGAG
jgi:cytochrome b